jgi:hypothetical protein
MFVDESNPLSPFPATNSRPLPLQISHESSARKGLLGGQGYSFQVRVHDMQIRALSDSIMEIKSS